MKRDDKKKVINKFAVHGKDTGSAEVQIAIITHRISDLTGHLKTHPKDIHSKTGLVKLVGKRRRLLNYLRSNRKDKYEKIVKELSLRK